MQTFKYEAFISYSRMDEKWERWKRLTQVLAIIVGLFTKSDTAVALARLSRCRPGSRIHRVG
jgi:hypothetical protein